MSSPQADDGEKTDGDDERPDVPEGVLRGIDDLAEGRTVGKEELKRILDN